MPGMGDGPLDEDALPHLRGWGNSVRITFVQTHALISPAENLNDSASS